MGGLDEGAYQPPIGGWNRIAHLPDWLDESDDDEPEQLDGEASAVQNEDMEVEEEDSEPDSHHDEDERRVTTSDPPATTRKFLFLAKSRLLLYVHYAFFIRTQRSRGRRPRYVLFLHSICTWKRLM
jgi:hypothetical protein